MRPPTKITRVSRNRSTHEPVAHLHRAPGRDPTLLTVAVALAGAVAFRVLPVSSTPLPRWIFLPSPLRLLCRVQAPTSWHLPSRRRLSASSGHIAGVTEMTSSSTLSTTSITLQFDLSRDINGAARDVEAGINAARTYLPTNLPANPTYRLVNSRRFAGSSCSGSSPIPTASRNSMTKHPPSSSSAFRRFPASAKCSLSVRRRPPFVSKSIPISFSAMGSASRRYSN